jgi:hypothetical protein
MSASAATTRARAGTWRSLPLVCTGNLLACHAEARDASVGGSVLNRQLQGRHQPKLHEFIGFAEDIIVLAGRRTSCLVEFARE